MSIDPQKIDFSKMRPYQSLEKNDRESAGEKMSGGFSDYKNNSGASEEERQKYDKTGENNIFAGEKLMSVFGLLALSWKMFKERWKKFAGLVLLSIAISLIPNIISFVLGLFGGSSLSLTALKIIITLIFYIPSMLIGIAVIEIMRDKNLGVFEAIRNAAKKLLPFFITGLVGTLAVAVVLIINMIIVIAGSLIFALILSSIASLFDSGGVSLFDSGGVLMAFVNVIVWLLGFVVILLMLLPILIASIWLYFAMFAVILENMSPLESLSYSYELMKKKCLSVIWKNIAVAILFASVLALMFIAVFIPSIIIPFLMVIAAIAMIPVVLAVIFVVSPVMYLFQYNIYENLKAIKKDKLLPDCSTKHQGKIKIFAALGALIAILFILFSALSGFSFDNLKNKFIDTPLGSNFQDKTGEKDNPGEKAKNNETLSEIEKRDEQRISDLDSISLMLWHYKEKNGIYPTSGSVVDLSKDKVVASLIESANNGKKIPTDPTGKYYYGYKSDGETYELSAVLEDKNDKRCVVEGNFCIYKYRSDNEKLTEKPVARNLSIVSNPCTPATVTDIDGNIYNTVKIGSQCWMKENLKVTKNPEGKTITRHCYNNDSKICDTDGGLYDWDTAMNNSKKESAQGICPDSWHVPKDSEWYVLEKGLAIGNCSNNRKGLRFLSECDPAGAELKTGGHSGFEGILVGYSDPVGFFNNSGNSVYFLSSTEIRPYYAWVRILSSLTTVIRLESFKAGGYSLRCLKD